MYGEVIRRARRARGLTQAELAVNSGIDQPNISAIEHGRRLPSVDTLHRLLVGCGFELVASAGPLRIPFPIDDDPLAEEVEPAPPLTDDERVRVVTAVLQASEAIVRYR